MDFDRSNEELEKNLVETDRQMKQQQSEAEKKNNILPQAKEEELERKKVFGFTLRPSTRQILKEKANEQNYQSVSKFLEDLIRNL
ncbi:MAG: hypothetical protein L0K95_13705 [Tetragenococcus koreensis]|nr:hypothetical protein [Tetragenococcus koreensis]MDN6750876.1 hypothetical protein [Staphylococcus equorum]MDN6166905.1 hypothetical protein [Tetragenococcus koreensis]MDN6268557.1 hypothetical protein [Tetragenococcus koreensis]MDN6502011.1 hypothetical protein [Tetragenococcus koreensis]